MHKPDHQLLLRRTERRTSPLRLGPPTGILPLTHPLRLIQQPHVAEVCIRLGSRLDIRGQQHHAPGSHHPRYGNQPTPIPPKPNDDPGKPPGTTIHPIQIRNHLLGPHHLSLDKPQLGPLPQTHPIRHYDNPRRQSKASGLRSTVKLPCTNTPRQTCPRSKPCSQPCTG